MKNINWDEINNNPLKFTKKIELLEEILKIATEKYHVETPVLSDYTYDILMEILEGTDPDNKLVKKIGFKVFKSTTLFAHLDPIPEQIKMLSL